MATLGIPAQILLHSATDKDAIDQLSSELSEMGFNPAVKTIPPQRNLGDLAWLVLISVPLQAFLVAFGERAAAGAYTGLVKSLRRTGPAILRDQVTDLRIRLDDDLPDEAFRQLASLDPAQFPPNCIVHFDRAQDRWSPLQ